MLDIKWIRENPQALDNSLISRGMSKISDKLLVIDTDYRECLTKLQELQNERNIIAKQIGEYKRNKKDSSELTQQSIIIKQKIDNISQQTEILKNELDEILCSLPNIVSLDVPKGKNEDDNLLVKEWGKIRSFDFEPLKHFDIGENLNLMDFKKSSEMSGSRFVLLKGQLAKLERALMNFMLDIHINEFGYQEISPPSLVLDKALYNVGLLPKFADNAFRAGDKHWLIPTAEVSLTNLVANEVIEMDKLPLRFVAGTPCFRSEAGAAGKDTRGMIRLHQFYKVELVSITHPAQTANEHEHIIRCAESILEKLALPYRRMLLCSGDLGVQSEKTYDLEVWLPGENTYREVSSCSSCNDYQSRRMHAKYCEILPGGKRNLHLLHTLNGSGLAIGRTMVAILENYQQKNGEILLPKALHSYMGGIEKITSEQS